MDQIFALLGSNTAGKTTTLRMLPGITRPSGGGANTNGTLECPPSGDLAFCLVAHAALQRLQCLFFRWKQVLVTDRDIQSGAVDCIPHWLLQTGEHHRALPDSLR